MSLLTFGMVFGVGDWGEWRIFGNKMHKKGEKFVYIKKKSLLCTPICGASLKASRKDAPGCDMRTAMPASKLSNVIE